MFATLLQAAWGAWLLLVPNVFETSMSYDYLASKGGETFWGAVMLGIGLCAAYSVWLRRSVFTIVCEYISLIVWLMIAVSIAIPNLRTTGTLTYSMVAAFYSLYLILESRE